jgi:hypothetical protein
VGRVQKREKRKRENYQQSNVWAVCRKIE